MTTHDLSLGFTAHPNPVSSSTAAAGHRVGYNISPEMGTMFVATTFHHPQYESSFMTHTEGNNPATALGVGVGLIPLLTSAGDDEHDLITRSRAAAAAAATTGTIHLWQNHQHQHQQNNNNNEKNISFDAMMQPSMSMSGGGGGTATCRDCGNQAKKDCSHRRCRTCCKSRGFDCTTHVKSTWVPAARRRERQCMASGGGGGGGGASSGSTCGGGVKKPKLIISSQTTSHTSTSNTPPRSRSFETSSSHQEASFKETLPGQVRAPAVFKCVKVTAVDDGEDEFAYQAVVKIGGHVFKGFLYDQGVEPRDGSGFPNLSELHLGGGGGGNASGSGGGGGDHVDVYGSSHGGGLIGSGSGYGNTIN